MGDAEIGRDANIGAGTITCNYDGFAKHETVIGDRVQVGSDSTLVAPVIIAADAYVATATTVRRDVPAGALVFNPRDQQHRAGWVAEFRARKQGRSDGLQPATSSATATRKKGKVSASSRRQKARGKSQKSKG